MDIAVVLLIFTMVMKGLGFDIQLHLLNLASIWDIVLVIYSADELTFAGMPKITKKRTILSLCNFCI